MDAIENLAKFEEDQINEDKGPSLEDMVKAIYDFIIGEKPEEIKEEDKEEVEVEVEKEDKE